MDSQIVSPYLYNWEYASSNMVFDNVVAVTGNEDAGSSSIASDLSEDDAGAQDNEIGDTWKNSDDFFYFFDKKIKA